LFSRSVTIGAEELLASGEAALAKLGEELRHSLEMCQNEVRGQPPERLVLCGAAARIEGIAAHMARDTNLPCESQIAAAALRKPLTGPSMSDAEFSAVSIDALIGIALAPHLLELNLVSETVALKREMIEKSRALTAMGACAMTALMCASLYGLTKLRLEKQQLASLKAEMARIEPDVRRIEQEQEIVAVVRERGDVRGSPVNVLQDLMGLVPKDVVFVNSLKFDSEKNSLLLEGTASDTKVIRALVEGIEGSPRFADATESNTRLDSASGKWRFQIGFAVEKPR
jgi:Tfp pilus assembly protein PilN